MSGVTNRFWVQFGINSTGVADGTYLKLINGSGGIAGFGIPMIRPVTVTGTATMVESISGGVTADAIEINIIKGTNGSTSDTIMCESQRTFNQIADGDALTFTDTFTPGDNTLAAGDYLKVRLDRAATITIDGDVIVVVELQTSTNLNSLSSA